MAYGQQGEDFVTREEVQRQRNIFERVKSIFDVDDDFLAAMLANQVMMGRLEQRENELLRAIREEGFVVNVDEVDIDAAAVTAGIREANRGVSVDFPSDGSRFSFPAAGRNDPIVIDLEAGNVRIPGVADKEMASSLPEIGAERMLSAQMWADDDLKVRTFDGRSQTNVFEHDQCTYLVVDSNAMTRLELEASRTFNFRGQVSTGIRAPIRPIAIANHQRRFGHISTSTQSMPADATQGTFIPFIGPSAGDYDAADRPEAVSNFGTNTIHSPNIGQLIIIVEEVANNTDAEVQLLEWEIGGENRVADNDVHGTTETDPSVDANAVVTVSQNDHAVLETGINTHVKAMRARSSDGNEVELRVQYEGFSPSLR